MSLRIRFLRPSGGPALALLVALLLAPRASVPAEDQPADEATLGQRPPEAFLSAESLVEAKRTFFVHCSNCHGTDGWGGPCPNLADEVTLHGGRYADMLATITRGVPGTEMPRWFGKLEYDRIMRVAAYVYTLKGTRIPKTDEERQAGARRRATLYIPPPPGEPARAPRVMDFPSN